MNKKIKFLALVIIFLFTSAVLLLLLKNQPTTTPIPPLPTPTLVQIAPRKITISGIQTNNFLSSPIETNKNGDVLFRKTQNYQIAYFKEFNQFGIVIIAPPFEQARSKAENEFLKTLGITQEQACKLNVTVGFSRFAPSEVAGKNFPLSFCQKKE